MQRKKRIGFITSSPLLRTGFSRNSKALLTYLFKNRTDLEFYFMHQGIFDGDQNLKRLPFKENWGALNQDVINLVNQRPPQERGNWERLASYGNFRVEDFVIKNELDVVFHIEDIWSSHDDFYWKKDWFSFIKKNFVQWTTLDSLPILNQAKIWAKQTENFWVWASFAEKAMKAESEEYNNVRTVPGCLNTECFKPLPSLERNELRKKFGINSNDKIFLYVGRNQLRKLFLSNIEALAKFKKQHPEHKAKLLFHCSWSEGWNLPEAIQEFGLNNEDVLTTYACGNCKFWHVMPFQGEGLQCPHCHAEKSFSTCGVNSTLTEENLAKVYGISDAASSIFTSGGLEYFNVESLLCGLPLISTPYSSGEDFTDQSFVEAVDGNFYRECGTNFLKFNPNPNSIVKFFNKICEMSPEKYRELSNKGREWALKTFDVSVVGKTVEKFIDSCEPLDWSKYHEFKKDYDTKNPNAPVNNAITENSTWVKELYKNILKMDVKDEDEGLKGWVQSLQNGTPRENIENSFRQIAVQENSKHNQVDFKTLLDLDRPNKRGIIVVKESGGDIFITTSLFKDFKNRYKGYDLYVMCDGKYSEILAGNPYIHKVLPWFPPAENEMFCLSSGQDKKDKLFDYFAFPAIATQKWLNYLSHSNSRSL